LAGATLAGAALAGAAGLLVTAQAGASSGLDVAIGRALFKRAWVPAPSSTLANDGLGPLYNARACISCHQGLDRAPLRVSKDGAVESETLVLRFSDRHGRPDAVYGAQLQTSSVVGVRPEGALRLDGDRRPKPAGLAYGEPAAGTRWGGRVAPALHGLGALADIPDAAILARADPDDRDGDGVRGRANLDASGRPGRFGWKAQSVTIAEQTMLAFSSDLGLSTPRFPSPWGDCSPAQAQCRAAFQGGTLAAPEIGPEIVARTVAYLAAAPAPAAARADPAGAALFGSTGCAACHAPSMPSPSGPVPAFSDLLLHDLGPALDGGATEPGVAPTEWRTAPLWGLSRALADGAGLLHDGRARDVAEAIRQHGGEAASARHRFDQLTQADRDRLLAYVGAL
jgi:CxxC motif-containing protein (DUF1111 family)